MSNVFTLDALREETARRYAPTEVDLGDGTVVELKSILRLREKDRKAVLDAITELNEIELEDDEDDDAVAEWSEKVCDCTSKIFRLIASASKKLIVALEDDDPQIQANLHTTVLSRWIDGSQLGEASSSPRS